MEILVKELTDVVSSTPNRQELELDVDSSKKDKGDKDGGFVTTVDDSKADKEDPDVDNHAAMSFVNVGTAVVAGTIAIFLQLTYNLFQP